MRILLLRSMTFGFLNETNITGVYPTLGFAYIAAVLRNARYEVVFLDNQILRLPNNLLKKEIKKIAADIVLLSAMTPLWPEIVTLSKLIKEVCPSVMVGVGGPHLTAYPQESLSSQGIDFGIYGEGENTVLAVIKAIEQGRDLDGIKGCVFRKDGKVFINAPREEINDLDSVPFPAMELLPYKRYFALSVRQPFFTLITSRGCPYTCKFCFQGYLGRYRSRSPENVVNEMEILVKKYKIKEIVIFDETFGVETERAIRICELIRKKDLGFRWDIRTRIDLLNEEILKSLKSAGCYRLHLGIESGNQEILDKMGKGINIFEIEEKIRLARRFGFELRGYFMLAYPGETYKTIFDTIKFARDLPLDWASFTVAMGLPETKIYTQALENRRFQIDYWKEYTKANILMKKPYFLPPGLRERDLFILKKKAYLEFYLRPRIAWNILKNLNGIPRNLPLFIKLFSSIHYSITKI